MNATDERAADQEEPTPQLSWMRVLWVLVIALMISLAQSLLTLLAVVQIIIMAASKGRPNAELARFGGLVGDWMASAARFVAAASDEKPWPWAPIDR